MSKTDGKPWEGDGYIVSPYNFAAEVTRDYTFRKPFIVQDVTILKMDHLDRSRMYKPDEYVEVCELLDEAGFNSTQFITGMYEGSDKEDSIWAGLRAVARRGLKLRPRANGGYLKWPLGSYKEKVDFIVDTGARGLCMPARPGDPPRPNFFGQQRTLTKEEEEKLAELPLAIEYAHSQGLEVIINSAYSVLNDLDTFIEERNEFIRAGADALQFSDTKGYATPDATRYFVKAVRSRLIKDVPVYYHAHNGYGQGTALALAAATAGAYPQGAACGVADNGFAALEEVVMALELQYGVDTGIQLDVLPRLCHTVERITGVTLPPWKAVTGANITMPAYGKLYVKVIQGADMQELLLTPYAPRLVGRRADPTMYYGLLTDETVKGKLDQMGLPSGEAMVATVRAALRRELDAQGNRYPVFLNDAEVERVCSAAVKSALASGAKVDATPPEPAAASGRSR